MRVILVGYGKMFRSLALGILNSKHKIVGVLRQEMVTRCCINRFLYDYIKPSDDYLFIKNHLLHEINAPSVNSKEFRKAVKKLKADVVIVGSWSEKFSMETINTITNGFINVHPSLLPKYRGPNPYIQVILNNEKLTGITFHLMDVNYDTGSILHQKEIQILPDDTGGSLRMRCCDLARYEVGFLLNNLKSRILNQRSQNEQEATYQSQISVSEAILDFNRENSEEIARRIRAFSPWLNCFIPVKGNFFTFKKYEIIKENSDKKAGTIVDKTKSSVFIVCNDCTVMRFSGVQINSPFSKFLPKDYWNKFMEINDIAI